MITKKLNFLIFSNFYLLLNSIALIFVNFQLFNANDVPISFQILNKSHFDKNNKPTFLLKQNGNNSLASNIKVKLPKSCIKIFTNEAPLFFEQRLDHFNTSNNVTWKQLYYVNMGHFDNSPSSNSPIFLMFEETALPPYMLYEGQIYENAKKFNAGMVVLSTRHLSFFRKTPTRDTSKNNLKYYSIEQKLKDATVLIDVIKRKYNIGKNHKWIVFGGSFSGNLAVWFRLKYPHLVVGAVAYSAPVQAKLDFDAFFKTVNIDLGPKCSSEIRSAMNEFTQLLSTDSGREKLTKKFKLCTPLQTASKQDISVLVNWVANSLIKPIIDNSTRTNYINRDICSIVTKNHSYPSALDRLVMTPGIKYSRALSQYKSFVEQMSNVSWSSGYAQERIRMYLQCSALGQFQTSDYPDLPFNNYFSVDFFIQQCQDIFGPQFSKQKIQESVDKTNKVYGGANVSATTLSNVVFTYGLTDPWHELGVLKQPPNKPTITSIIIPGASLCADLYKADPDDSPELKNAREQVTKAIGQFLKEKP